MFEAIKYGLAGEPVNADIGYQNMRAIWARRVQERDEKIADLEAKLTAAQSVASVVGRTISEEARKHPEDVTAALAAVMLERDALVQQRGEAVEQCEAPLRPGCGNPQSQMLANQLITILSSERTQELKEKRWAALKP